MTQGEKPVPSVADNDIRWMRKALYLYFRSEGRSYPWRDIDNTFLILITELMLQRTKADDVASYWQIIEKNLYEPEAVKNSEEILSSLFVRLGLMRRKQWILEIARLVSDLGNIPNNLDRLRALPGVGYYTACATLAFGFGINEGLIDGNVIRLFERFWGTYYHHDLRQKVRFWRPISKKLGKSSYTKQVFWGLLDLSGQICTSRNPKCNECPLQRKCLFGSQNRMVSRFERQHK